MQHGPLALLGDSCWGCTPGDKCVWTLSELIVCCVHLLDSIHPLILTLQHGPVALLGYFVENICLEIIVCKPFSDLLVCSVHLVNPIGLQNHGSLPNLPCKQVRTSYLQKLPQMSDSSNLLLTSWLAAHHTSAASGHHHQVMAFWNATVKEESTATCLEQGIIIWDVQFGIDGKLSSFVLTV